MGPTTIVRSCQRRKLENTYISPRQSSANCGNFWSTIVHIQSEVRVLIAPVGPSSLGDSTLIRGTPEGVIMVVKQIGADGEKQNMKIPYLWLLTRRRTGV